MASDFVKGCSTAVLQVPSYDLNKKPYFVGSAYIWSMEIPTMMIIGAWMFTHNPGLVSKALQKSYVVLDTTFVN